MSDVRLVPMSREQRDAFEYLADVLQSSVAVPVWQTVAAWDAAPADPAEAASEAIGVEFMGLDDEECHDAATAVLRALGWEAS